jgi:hypothetical protein
MVAAGRIDEQHVRRFRERSDCGLERRSLPQREQAGLVGITRFAPDDGGRYDTPAADRRRRGPGRLALSSGPCWPRFKADEAAADRGGIGKMPLLGRRPRKLLLRSNQFLRRAGPGVHWLILAVTLRPHEIGARACRSSARKRHSVALPAFCDKVWARAECPL